MSTQHDVVMFAFGWFVGWAVLAAFFVGAELRRGRVDASLREHLKERK